MLVRKMKSSSREELKWDLNRKKNGIYIFSVFNTYILSRITPK